MNSEALEQLVLDNVACPRCLAGPGRWCRTTTNRVATRLHSGRTWVADQAWGMGWTDGHDEGVQWASR